ncbi:MAG: macro domain-containing protein [Anaerolineales bacterium]|nr:macro domain-containing protein [Anaerolineales bacterium]
MNNLILILVDPQPGVCMAWETHFEELPNVQIVNDYFENLSNFDCMVSAANSFGLMDGGVDAAITRFFGRSLQDRVQQYILTNFLGEQPVGTSFIIETGNEKHPFLAHTPTMRVPLPIYRTDNVYLAMWAMLLAVHQHNQLAEHKISQIACPGLGTATGDMPFDEAARQMALAYRHFLAPPQSISWHYAQERQLAVRYGGNIGL